MLNLLQLKCYSWSCTNAHQAWSTNSSFHFLWFFSSFKYIVNLLSVPKPSIAAGLFKFYFSLCSITALHNLQSFIHCQIMRFTHELQSVQPHRNYPSVMNYPIVRSHVLTSLYIKCSKLLPLGHRSCRSTPFWILISIQICLYQRTTIVPNQQAISKLHPLEASHAVLHMC